MGYKKSFNLVTLQLIIPLSTMSKAEYKEAYGIDLDDIDIEKVTLIQEDGSKNKYFVDEVKTTENGIDIYAGGKILSIGSSVSVVSNAYSVANSKPIYLHPVLAVGTTMGIGLIIINNDPKPFETWAEVKSYMFGVANSISDTARFPCTGSMTSGGVELIARNLDARTTNTLSFYGRGVDSTAPIGVDITSLTIDNVYDGVNKIN